MKAKQLMTRDPRTCEPDHNLLCALRIMRDEDCGIVPVTEGNGQARVVGVVTDRDIALHLGDVDKKPSEVEVRDVMSTHLVSCATGDEDSQISRLMQKAQVRRVLVVEDGKLEGVISTADLARATGSGKDIGEQIQRVIVEVSQ
ncbi:MAG TPA: CBS domain-containing protein [Thermoanaerobaculia bacterium]|nr:CBS domain-containing protein [Thermoanaerobaculia bacterium]